jgi:hypothetical protein
MVRRMGLLGVLALVCGLLAPVEVEAARTSTIFASRTGFLVAVDLPQNVPTFFPYPPTTQAVATLSDGTRILIYSFTRIDQSPFASGLLTVQGYRRFDGTIVATRIFLQ